MKQQLLYLNAGRGDPCAGHNRATAFPWTSRNDTDSILEENFGFAEPIGSMRGTKHGSWVYSYLNAGTGDPWAGQRSAI